MSNLNPFEHPNHFFWKDAISWSTQKKLRPSQVKKNVNCTSRLRSTGAKGWMIIERAGATLRHLHFMFVSPGFLSNTPKKHTNPICWSEIFWNARSIFWDRPFVMPDTHFLLRLPPSDPVDGHPETNFQRKPFRVWHGTQLPFAPMRCLTNRYASFANKNTHKWPKIPQLSKRIIQKQWKQKVNQIGHNRSQLGIILLLALPAVGPTSAVKKTRLSSAQGQTSSCSQPRGSRA